MTKVARKIADYVIYKGAVEESDRNIYEYGFLIFLETGLFTLFCLIISIYLHMFIECIIFYAIFTPIRTYAGGLHLEKFWSCFFLSCLTFIGVLFMVKYLRIPMFILVTVLLILEIVVYFEYPVENINRKVEDEENNYFKFKLRKFLYLDSFIALFFVIDNKGGYLLEIVIIFLVIALTMLLGKHKNNKMLCKDNQ